jgi:hypothetical protein
MLALANDVEYDGRVDGESGALDEVYRRSADADDSP